eukprot:SAG11_NODE_23015_length_396_cov_1.154882_1_plen_72_part_00
MVEPPDAVEVVMTGKEKNRPGRLTPCFSVTETTAKTCVQDYMEAAKQLTWRRILATVVIAEIAYLKRNQRT